MRLAARATNAIALIALVTFCTSAAPPDSAPLNELQTPTAHDDVASAGLHPTKPGEQNGSKLGGHDRDRCGCAASRNPVAPADDEAGVFAERIAREDVLAPGARDHRPELSDLSGAQQRVEPPITHTARNSPRCGSCSAISPGARRMPAPIVLPTATATPKPTPSTCNKRPRGARGRRNRGGRQMAAPALRSACSSR